MNLKDADEKNASASSALNAANGKGRQRFNNDKVVEGISAQYKVKDEEVEVVEYYWQAYPKDLLERIDWAISLMLSRKGTRWNWRIPPLPDLLTSVTRSLEHDKNQLIDLRGEPSPITPSQIPTTQTSFTGIRTFDSPDNLFHSQIPRLLFSSVLISICLLAMNADPYFHSGPDDSKLPPSHLNRLPPLLLKIYRQFLAFFVLVPAILTLGPALTPLLPIALSRRYAVIRNSIYSSTWLYPTSFGSPSLIFTKGLNGLWGSFWHQEFRFIFSSPVNYFIRVKVCGLISAFTISGLIQLGMSTSQIRGQSGWNSFAFFIVQGVGVVVQMVFCSVIRKQIKDRPMWLRKAGNGLFALFWLCLTANLLLDDLARLGLWSAILGIFRMDGLDKNTILRDGMEGGIGGGRVDWRLVV